MPTANTANLERIPQVLQYGTQIEGIIVMDTAKHLLHTPLANTFPELNQTFLINKNRISSSPAPVFSCQVTSSHPGGNADRITPRFLLASAGGDIEQTTTNMAIVGPSVAVGYTNKNITDGEEQAGAVLPSAGNRQQ